ncbi:radical SAM protein [bacterium]|nr:radical SAM protein [bacterium]
MKSSNYNYIFYKDEYVYFYNGLTHAYFRCSSSLGKKLEDFILKPNIYSLPIAGLSDLLESQGFIISDNLEELQEIRKNYAKQVNRQDYFLVINPTLNCNFKCHYCVQDHISSCMSTNTMEAVKRHVDYMLEEKKISSLTLEWFGGEPFLYYNEIIRPISEYAKTQCEKFGVAFFNGATTNGSLITRDVCKEFKNLRFTAFQITLDGDRLLHNSIKFSDNIESTFDTTLVNIKNILESTPDCRINLRINYTSATLESNIVEEVCGILPKEVRSRIKILLKKVWQEETDNSRFKNYQRLLNDFKREGFNVERLDIIRNFMPCYVNKRYYSCINYDGGVIKCTNCDLLYSKNPPGRLAKSGEVIWRDRYDERSSEPAFENNRCLACNLLPICMSHCPKNYLEGSVEMCKLKYVDFDLKSAVIAYIDDMYEVAERNTK